MSIILNGYGGGGAGSVASTGSLYVRGDDDGYYYTVGMQYDPVLGIYLWSVGTYGPQAPDHSVNISSRVLGPAYFTQDNTGTWHTFVMTSTDPPTFGYVWTDVSQFTTPAPAVFRRGANFRADDGVYVTDIDGSQIHKMGVTGGMWSELNQGYTIPL